MRTTLLLFLVLLASCAGRSPNLQVVEASLVEQSDEAAVFSFTIEAENPHEVSLPLEDLRYTVRITDGQDRELAARTHRSPEATLRRFGSQRITFPAVVTLTEPLVGEVRYRVVGRLQYRNPGEINEILYDYALLRPSESFEGAGTIVVAD